MLILSRKISFRSPATRANWTTSPSTNTTCKGTTATSCSRFLIVSGAQCASVTTTTATFSPTTLMSAGTLTSISASTRSRSVSFQPRANMILTDAEKLARELMAQFGLSGWIFEFDNAKRRFGSCLHNSGGWRSLQVLGVAKGKITLSRDLTLVNVRSQVEDTIRHEIAHALVTPKPRVRGQKRDSHGAEWKAMCAKTGATPKSCVSHDDEVGHIIGDWQATCGVCGKLYSMFREPKGEYYCPSKECKRMSVPYIHGIGRHHPARTLAFRHVNALPEVNSYAEQRRKAIEAVRAQLKSAEPSSSMMQCVKCDSKSLGCKVCPDCGGELLLA